MTDGAERPTRSPIRASGILQSCCKVWRICKSIPSSSRPSLVPNFIRLSPERTLRIVDRWSNCQRFLTQNCGIAYDAERPEMPVFRAFVDRTGTWRVAGRVDRLVRTGRGATAPNSPDFRGEDR